MAQRSESTWPWTSCPNWSRLSKKIPKVEEIKSFPTLRTHLLDPNNGTVESKGIVEDFTESFSPFRLSSSLATAPAPPAPPPPHFQEQQRYDNVPAPLVPKLDLQSAAHNTSSGQISPREQTLSIMADKKRQKWMREKGTMTVQPSDDQQVRSFSWDRTNANGDRIRSAETPTFTSP